MNFVGLIPARGGSKGIKKKSIADCAGKPLIQYTIEAAKKSKLLTRTIVSTDDNEIAKVCMNLDAEVPFIRPSSISTDDAPMVSVMQHAISWLENDGSDVDAIVLLQPTSPLRSSKNIDEAIDLWMSKSADTVVSVQQVPHNFTPVSLMVFENEMGQLGPYQSVNNEILRRQDKPVMFARNGPAVLVVSSSRLKSGILYGTNTYGYIMSDADSIDVDGEFDLKLAECILGGRK